MDENYKELSDLAIIVLNYNSSDDTIKCVKQLLSFSDVFPHIIVVDNCSTDSSFEHLSNEFHSVNTVDVILSANNRGYSTGNNYGIRFAKSKYSIKTIGIMNPDVIIPNSGVLKKLAFELYEENNICIAGANIKNSNSILDSAWDIPSVKNLILYHCIIPWIRKNKKELHKRKIKDKVCEVECIVGCFFFANLELFESIGLFDENVFLYNEENILGIKCKNKNYKEVLVLDHFYYHNHKDNKQKKSFRNKINSSKNAYLSRRYLCLNYYSKMWLPLLWLVESINKAYLMLAYLLK